MLAVLLEDGDCFMSRCWLPCVKALGVLYDFQDSGLSVLPALWLPVSRCLSVLWQSCITVLAALCLSCPGTVVLCEVLAKPPSRRCDLSPCRPPGAAGCGRGSTTTRAPPTVEPEIQAVTVASNERSGTPQPSTRQTKVLRSQK